MNGDVFVIVPVVEGQGDVEALPVLVRRILAEIDPTAAIRVEKPLRSNRDKIVKPGELERFVQLAARKAAGAVVLVLLDADDDCPATLGPALLARAEAVSRGAPVAVVLANREFEAWFLAAAVSLRSRRGLPDDLVPPEEPESIRDAKGWLQERRTDGYAYSPTTDQPALASGMDLGVARSSAPSFDKLWRDLERLLGERAETRGV